MPPEGYYYLKCFEDGKREWEFFNLDDNPYTDMNSEQYQGWHDGWIFANKTWNPTWYKIK